MKAARRKTWDERGKTSRGISGGASSRIAEQCDSKWKEVGNGGNGSGSRGGLGVVEQGHGQPANQVGVLHNCRSV